MPASVFRIVDAIPSGMHSVWTGHKGYKCSDTWVTGLYTQHALRNSLTSNGVCGMPYETDLFLQPRFVGQAEHDVVARRLRVECPAAVVHAVGTNRIEQASRAFPAIVQRPLGVEIVRKAADVLRRSAFKLSG